MSGPLSDKPDGTTHHAQVANTCLPAGERPNKTPVFISGFGDARSFLACVAGDLPWRSDGPTKGREVDGRPINRRRVQSSVSAVRSLDGKEGVRFHTFTLTEDRCVRILVKSLGWGMPENVVRKELESLKIRVQGVTQLRHDQDLAKDRLPTPLHCISGARALGVESAITY